MLTSRLPEDQPVNPFAHLAENTIYACDCFRIPHAFYCATVTRDLVPGYLDSADGLADDAQLSRIESSACDR